MDKIKCFVNGLLQKIYEFGELRVSFKGNANLRLHKKECEEDIFKFDADEKGKTVKLADVIIVFGIISAVCCVFSLIDELFD